MPFSHITSKFQNYTYNDNQVISQYLINLKNSNQLDGNNLQIHGYLLPEILTLLKKAILNRFSSDILFQKNYWSWGFVTLYYSNFYLTQSLNRLSGNFFVKFNRGMKNIQLDYDDNQYKLLDSNSSDTHKKEFEKLRSNYVFLITNNDFNQAIPDDYTSRPFFNESKMRNEINYTLQYYKEFDGKLKNSINIEQCTQNYIDDNSNINEFRLLTINDSRFKIIFTLLNLIKKDNEIFEREYDNLILKIRRNLTNKNFHSITETLENKFKGYL